MESPLSPSQDVINNQLGPVVAGIWIQQLFLGFILAQMVDYYRYHFTTDLMFNKAIVTALLVLNLFIGGTDFHVLFRSTVLFYGHFEGFELQEWTMWTEPGLTAIIGFLAQLFFVTRCQRFVPSYYFTGVSLVLMLLSLGSGLAYSVSFNKNNLFYPKNLGRYEIPNIMWLITTATADICIAGALTFHLMKSRSMFNHQKTNAVLTRLMIATMETGAMTAIAAILNLVLYLPLQETTYHALPAFSLSRVYTMTVMVTLLSRKDNRAFLVEARAGMPTTLKLPPTVELTDPNLGDLEAGTT